VNPIRLSLLAEKTSYRTDPPSTGEPDWRWEDFAHAAGASGCTEIETAALEYRWRQAGKCRHLLFAELMLEAIKAQKRHRWPDRLADRRYLEPMVQLALDVEANPRLDGLAPLVVPCGEDARGKQQYRRYPGWWCLRLPWLSEAQWNKQAEPKYAVLRQPLDIWAGEAIRKCRRVLRDEV
jgi:hypothetical protein